MTLQEVRLDLPHTECLDSYEVTIAYDCMVL